MLIGCLCGCGNKGTADVGTETIPGTSLESSVENTAAPTKEPESSKEAEVTPAPEKEEIKVQQHEITMADVSPADRVADMRIGWNLGNTLDATGGSGLSSETSWGNPKTTKEMIDAILDEGFNVIRIPITWDGHFGKAPDYKIDEAWLNRVQEVVDYAYHKGVYVILNIHHEGWHDPYYENQAAAEQKLKKVWTQIAEHFQEYDQHLIFEGMNEPRKCGTDLEWNGGDREGWDVVNALNQVFIDTIHNSGGKNPDRLLMIPGYAANCRQGIRNIKVPEGDDKLIVSVHAYEPYDFALNPHGRGLWNRDTEAIDRLMQDLKELFLDKDIAVIIGEFGAAQKPVEGNESSRAEWAEYFLEKAREIGVPCVWWDNGYFTGDGEPFGLIDRITLEWNYPLIVEALKKGMK